MTATELEQYLYDHIPLSKAMEVNVVSVSDTGVVLTAPLAPNINHRETVFGGSASAVAILAAWSLLHISIRREGLASRLVIQRNTMDYTRPIVGTFTATSALAPGTNWPRFLRMLRRHGKARAEVHAQLEYAGEVCGSLTGEFVALG